MQTTKHPYELLFRWDRSGMLSGAHVQYRYVITDGGAVIGESVGSAEPIALETGDGFPLSDLLDAAQISALAAMTTARTDAEAARAELAEAQRWVCELEAELVRLKGAAISPPGEALAAKG